jgi:hypothetical protein
MTAEEALQLVLSNNDDEIISSVCDSVTGSWESDALQWFHYGPFELHTGSLKIHTDGYWPHVERFVLVPSDSSRAPSGTQQTYMGILKQPTTNKSDNVDVEDAMIVVDGDDGGYYVFEFINEVCAEQVFLGAIFASGDSRPMMLAINREMVEEAFCDTEKGGYGEEDFETVRYGPYAAKSEVNTIKVSVEEGCFPNVGEIRVVRAGEEAN